MWKTMKNKIEKIDPTDKIIQRVIYEKPQIVVKILQDSGISVSNKPTLNEITTKTFTELYEKKNENFALRLDSLIVNGEYNNFVMVAVGIASSIFSGIMGSRQARKQMQLQMRIAVAKLENDKLLAEEELRVYGEVERTKILANSLTEYRIALQGESTIRQKNVYVYLVAIGLSISIIYGTNLLLADS
jgi:hypothetical protein